MTEKNDYRLFLNSEFTRLNEKLDVIKEQTTKTNDRVTHLEENIDSIDLRVTEHPFTCEKTKEIEAIKTDLEEYRFLKKYPKVMLFIVALLVAGVIMGAIGAVNSIGVKAVNVELKKDMNNIRYYLSPTRNGKPASIDTTKVFKK